MDEPTTGVDPLSRRQFWELIKGMRVHHAGMSIIVATAYMEEAEHLDWLVMMEGGRIPCYRNTSTVEGANRQNDD